MTRDPPTFLLVLPEFVMVTIVTVTAIATVLAMARVALYDALTFEIDFAWLGCGAIGMVALIMLGGGDLAGALMLAVLMMGATVLVRAFRPGRIGQGDIWLMGFIGLAAGPQYAMPVLALLVLLSVLTCALYSRARGKRLFKSMFPMALPGMEAAALAVALRAGSRVGDVAGIAGISGMGGGRMGGGMHSVLMAGLCFCAAAIAVHVIRAAIHRRTGKRIDR